MKKPYGLMAVCLAASTFVPALAEQNGARLAPTPGPIQDAPRFVRHGIDKVPNQYIVVLDEDAAGVAGDFASASVRAERLILRTASGRVTRVYAHALNGFAAEMSEAEAIALSKDPDVRFVEEDALMEAVATQNNPPWGLDRIDQRDRPLSASYTYTSTGAGVNAYIVDTGILRTHAQFGGRAFVGFDAVGDGGDSNDCNGHGTHVAGTVGGSTYGVAKSVRLYAVRVLNCSGSGTTAGVIAGVDWVTRNHIKPAVANMSLGGGVSASLDTAVRNSIAAGVTYAIAAGNSNVNASNASPARVSEAITVGATTNTDARSSFSNYGSVVDIFAPGSAILSSWYTSTTATATLSGTSMAAPHVAGVAALYLQTNTTASPAAVRNAIVNGASLNKLTGLPSGTANRLLFASF